MRSAANAVQYAIGTLLLACHATDSVEPGGGRTGNRLTTGWAALEWSIEGTEILYTSGPDTRVIPDPDWPLPLDQLLAVDATTGAVRVVVHECALRGHRPLATIAGVAYIRSCTGSLEPSLHLLLGGRDTLLASPVDWVTRTADREYLIYFVTSHTDGCVRCDSIGVIDLLRKTRRTLVVDLPLSVEREVTPSPDGSAILLPGWEASLGILRLDDGSWRELSLPDGAGGSLGWTENGIWFLAASGYSAVLLDPATLQSQEFDAGRDQVGPRRLNGGLAAPDGALSVWDWVCDIGPPPAGSGCYRARYALWLWHPLRGSNELLVRQRYDPQRHVDRSAWESFGAFSPDGTRFAYTLGDEIWALQLR